MPVLPYLERRRASYPVTWYRSRAAGRPRNDGGGGGIPPEQHQSRSALAMFGAWGHLWKAGAVLIRRRSSLRDQGLLILPRGWSPAAGERWRIGSLRRKASLAAAWRRPSAWDRSPARRRGEKPTFASPPRGSPSGKAGRGESGYPVAVGTRNGKTYPFLQRAINLSREIPKISGVFICYVII